MHAIATIIVNLLIIQKTVFAQLARKITLFL